MVNIFLKVTGPDIKGDSMDEKHTGEIDILQWSESSNLEISSLQGSTAHGKVTFSEVSIAKVLDSSSPHLVQNILKGTSFKSIKLTQYRGSAEGRIAFLEIEMTECILSNYSMSASSGIPSEALNINFGTIKFKYLDTTKEGGKAAQPKTIGYSRITNSKT